MKTNKRQSRRDFLKAAALGGTSLMLAACGGASAPPAAPAAAEPTAATGAAATAAPAEQAAVTAAPANAAAQQLDVWTGWTEAMASNIERILDNYNKSQDAIVAKHVVVPEAMNQKLLAAVAAGNPPGTAVVFGAATAYQLAAQDAILPLDQIGKSDQVAALKEWMLPAVWDLGVYEGKFVYASMWNQCMGVFVNTDMAEKAGVDHTKPPETLEELEAAWDKLTVTAEDGNITTLGGDFTWVEMIMGRFLGQFVNEDGTKITANHPNNVKALEWITNRWQRIGPDKLQDFYASLQGRSDRSAGQDPFLSGLIATTVNGPWQYDAILRYKPENFNYTVWPFPSPAGTKHGMYTYGDGWIIPQGAKQPEAAWDLISSLTGASDKDVYTSLFTTWQCVNGPVSPQIMEFPTFKQDVSGKCPGYEEIFLADLFEAEQYLYPPKIPTSSSYTSLLGAEWEKARLGQKTPQEALDFVQETAQQELDTWRAQQGT